jgi:hypothetical protein
MVMYTHPPISVWASPMPHKSRMIAALTGQVLAQHPEGAITRRSKRHFTAYSTGILRGGAQQGYYTGVLYGGTERGCSHLQPRAAHLRRVALLAEHVQRRAASALHVSTRMGTRRVPK